MTSLTKFHSVPLSTITLSGNPLSINRKTKMYEQHILYDTDLEYIGNENQTILR